MGAMFFGQYLLERGVIDRRQLLDALQRQRAHNRSLPEVALGENLFDAATAASIEATYRTGIAPVEELMMAIGGLGPDEVERLQVIQRADWVRIGAALVAGGHLTEQEVETHLEDYRARERSFESEIQAGFERLPSMTVVETSVRLGMRHIGRLVGEVTKVASVDVLPGIPDPGLRRRSSQRIVGDTSFTIILDLPPELAAIASQQLVGTALPPAGAAEDDALREVVNLVGGHACTQLESSGLRLRPEPPTSGRGGLPPEGEQRTVCTEVAAGDEMFGILVSLG
jgi:hypothetical protein